MFNKLLIVGDSFCRNRDKQSDWPVYLGKLLGSEVHGRGRGGCSWWSSRNDLNDYKLDRSSTILIVVHTESIRLPNDHNYPVNAGVLKSVPGTPADDLKDKGAGIRQLAIDFYTSELFSLSFCTWAQQAWIAELDSQNDFFATVHVPAFTSVNLSRVKNGIVMTPGGKFASLRDVSEAEVGDITWSGADSRSNHLKDFNNVKFAEAIADTVKNLSPGAAGHYTFKNMSEWDLTPVKFTRPNQNK